MDSVADHDRVCERLGGEFAQVDPVVVEELVRCAHRDLAGAPAGALPELVERLARVRLAEGEAPAASTGSGV